MKHLLYVVLFIGFFVAQAQNEGPNPTERTVFNPLEKKAEICQELEEIKETLSCEGTSCPPLYDSAAIFLPLQLGAAYACSFECVVGEQICDETLNPDTRGKYLSYSGKESGCAVSSNVHFFDVEREEFSDEEGIKHIYERKIYEEGCEETTEYIEICGSDGKQCREIEMYSDEWYEYERQQQLAEYEASCFVPTEEDCKSIKQEMNQCVLGMAGLLSEALCAPSTNNLWRYRKYGPQGWLNIRRKSSFKSMNLDDEGMKEPYITKEAKTPIEVVEPSIEAEPIEEAKKQGE